MEERTRNDAIRALKATGFEAWHGEWVHGDGRRGLLAHSHSVDPPTWWLIQRGHAGIDPISGLPKLLPSIPIL